MKKNNILKKIKSGEVKMKPKWRFVIKKWSEVGLWIGSIGLVVVASLSMVYFITTYDPRFLMEFGDLGWKIFYEDFPYVWIFVAAVCLISGTIALMKTANNYKRSTARNFMLTSAIILVITVAILFFETW